jgi:hypothetical protein
MTASGPSDRDQSSPEPGPLGRSEPTIPSVPSAISTMYAALSIDDDGTAGVAWVGSDWNRAHENAEAVAGVVVVLSVVGDYRRPADG